MALVKRWGPTALALAACLLALLSFEWRQVASILAGLPVMGLLLIMSGVTLAVFLIGALRWIAVTRMVWSAAVIRDVYLYMAVVMGVSMVTPMQLGEVLKVKFARDSGLPLGNSIVNLALERVIDVAAIAAMTAYGLSYSKWGSVLFSSAATIAVLAAGMCAPALLQWLADRFALTHLGGHLRVIAGEALPLSTLAVMLACTVAKWGLTLLAWMVLVRAVGIPLTFSQGMLLVGAVTAISILSMVPAGIGVQEMSTRGLLVVMGADPVQAESAAILLRVFTPVMVILALAHVPFLNWEPKALARPPSRG